MNADSYFEIGSSHWVCEDYALAGNDNDLCYAIVCDGCSSSHNTDVGARLLAHIAKDALIYMNNQGLLTGHYKPYNAVFNQLVMKKVLEVSTSLGIRKDALDTTLLVAAAKGEYERFLMGWGDGFFIIKLANGITNVIRMEYGSNAPYYLTYEMDPIRKALYKKEHDPQGEVLDLSITDVFLKYDAMGSSDLYIFKDRSEEEIPSMYQAIARTIVDSPEDYDLEEEIDETELINIDSIIVSSDGLNSYESNPKNSKRISYGWIDILPHIMEFRNPVGEFVKRRMRKAKKNFDKEGIVHFDDVSVAAINFK